MSPIAKFQVSVAYPPTTGATFDMAYYLAKHMPLIESKWKLLGLESYRVVEYDTSDPSKLPPLQVICILTWKDEASFKAASQGEDAKVIFSDVPNFTGITPQILPGKVY